jgi:4-hydroxybenzoate polyprenyltransferase
MVFDLVTSWVVLGVGSLLPLGIGFWLQPRLTRELLRDLRVPRILHFVALGGLGMALHLRTFGSFESLPLGKLAVAGGLLVAALTYAAVFAIVTNNITDLEADRISNPDRPLVRGTVDKRSYLVAGIFALVWALVIAACTHVALLWGILGISAGYYVYSCPPLRLKRIPIVAKLVIGLNSWIVAVCGFALAGGNPLEFPWIWTVFILVPLSFAANFIDLKDTEGDRATGIATLPVLLGERRARHVIVAGTLATYLMGGILLGLPWVYPLNAGAAALHIFFLYRKPYDERWVFLIHVGAIFGLDIFLFWT